MTNQIPSFVMNTNQTQTQCHDGISVGTAATRGKSVAILTLRRASKGCLFFIIVFVCICLYNCAGLMQSGAKDRETKDSAAPPSTFPRKRRRMISRRSSPSRLLLLLYSFPPSPAPTPPPAPPILWIQIRR